MQASGKVPDVQKLWTQKWVQGELAVMTGRTFRTPANASLTCMKEKKQEHFVQSLNL